MSRKLLKSYHTIGFIASFMLMGLLLAGTQSCSPQSETVSEDELLSIKADSSYVMLRYRTNLFVMPSAHQTSLIIKRNNIDFDEGLLNPVSNVNRYSSSFKKAINLGVYGTDMGYLSLFGRKQEALAHFSAIRELADGLQLGDIIDDKTIAELENFIGDPDSVIVLLANTFQGIDHFLLQNNREAIAVLAIAGSWVESAHLAFGSLGYSDSEDFISHLVSQKYPLEKLVRLLAPYYSQTEDFTSLIDQLTDIAYEFDCIDIEQQYQKPMLDPVERTATIRHGTETELHAYDLAKLSEKITQLRNQLIE